MLKLYQNYSQARIFFLRDFGSKILQKLKRSETLYCCRKSISVTGLFILIGKFKLRPEHPASPIKQELFHYSFQVFIHVLVFLFGYLLLVGTLFPGASLSQISIGIHLYILLHSDVKWSLAVAIHRVWVSSKGQKTLNTFELSINNSEVQGCAFESIFLINIETILPLCKHHQREGTSINLGRTVKRS